MLLSCTEAVGIKLPTLLALWEVHSLGSARGRGEIRQRPTPAERGCPGDMAFRGGSEHPRHGSGLDGETGHSNSHWPPRHEPGLCLNLTWLFPRTPGCGGRTRRSGFPSSLCLAGQGAPWMHWPAGRCCFPRSCPSAGSEGQLPDQFLVSGILPGWLPGKLRTACWGTAVLRGAAPGDTSRAWTRMPPRVHKHLGWQCRDSRVLSPGLMFAWCLLKHVSYGKRALTRSPSSLVQLFLQPMAEPWQSGWKN